MKYLWILSLFFIYGCYVPKKAERQLDRIEKKYPDLLASRALKLYPVVERIDSIDVVKWRDSILNTIDTITISDTLLADCEYLKNDIRKAQKKIMELRGAISKPVTIIKYVNDSTRLYLMRQDMIKAEKQRDKFQGNYIFMMKLAISFLIMLVISLIIHIIRYYLKK